MRKAILLPVLALSAVALTGCGKKAQNEALEANESIAGDSNTMGEAVDDTNIATDAAFANAQAGYDADANSAAPAPPAPGGTQGSGDEGSGD